MLAIPAARLYIREVNRAFSLATKNSRPGQMSGKLREEIEHWKFLHDWEGFVPWRDEKHLQIDIATDASLFRWGAVVRDRAALGDFVPNEDNRPIHIKEAEALYL